METAVSARQTCEASFEAISALLKDDSSRILQPTGGTGRDARLAVHVHPRWPWKEHDESLRPEIGRYESVGTGQGRMNLSLHPEHSTYLPEIDGHLEVKRVAEDVSEFRFLGECAAQGLWGRLHGGSASANDAVKQLLDQVIGTVRAQLATSA